MSGRAKGRLAFGPALLFVVAGCVETVASSGGLSDNIEAPAGMAEACLSQAVRLTGVPSSGIEMRAPIETGGGPFIGITIAGESYGCRTEDDGSVTVFSQFAN